MARKPPRKPTLPKRGQEDADYDVGYARPPESSRFQLGKSGNPKGRPKKKQLPLSPLNEQRMNRIIRNEAARMIKVNDGPQEITIPMAQAVMRAIAINAVKGKHWAQRQFVELVQDLEKDDKRSQDEYVQTMIDYKIVVGAELERRKAQGITKPDPIPHPDDIIIDLDRCDVTMKGPFTKEEKVKWDRAHNIRLGCLEEIEALQAFMEQSGKIEGSDPLRNLIELEKQNCAMITSVIGNYPHGRPISE